MLRIELYYICKVLIMGIEMDEMNEIMKSMPYSCCMGQSIQEWTKRNFLKAVFHKFYLVYSWILCPLYHVLFIEKHWHYYIMTLIHIPNVFAIHLWNIDTNSIKNNHSHKFNSLTITNSLGNILYFLKLFQKHDYT